MYCIALPCGLAKVIKPCRPSSGGLSLFWWKRTNSLGAEESWWSQWKFSKIHVCVDWFSPRRFEPVDRWKLGDFWGARLESFWTKWRYRGGWRGPGTFVTRA